MLPIRDKFVLSLPSQIYTTIFLQMVNFIAGATMVTASLAMGAQTKEPRQALLPLIYWARE